MMSAVWMKFRCELRARWAAWVGVALLVGIVAGGVIVASAGARRTSSAHDRFRRELRSYDVMLQQECKPAVANEDPKRCVREVAALPAVADSAVVEEFTAFVATEAGRSVQLDPDDPCYSGPGEVSVLGDRTGRFGTRLNRVRIVEGRRANPSRAGEVVVTAAMADRLGLHPGSRLRVSMYHGDCDDPKQQRAPITVRVVGIGIAPGEVPPVSGYYLAFVHVTPAFIAREPAAERDVGLAVRLRDQANAHDLLARG